MNGPVANGGPGGFRSVNRTHHVSLALLLALACACQPARAQDGVAAEAHAVFEAPLPTEPPAAFSAVQSALAANKVYRARFTEEKRIKVLRRPLRSEGRLVFATGRGLWRQLTRPFAQEIVVTRAGISQRFADGRTEVVDLTKQPVAQAFVDAMLLIASGDLEGLRTHFELFFTGTEEAWTLGFRPRGEPLSRVIATMVLTGTQAKLSTLTVTEQSGDTTLTRYHDVEVAAELSSDDEALLRGSKK